MILLLGPFGLLLVLFLEVTLQLPEMVEHRRGAVSRHEARPVTTDWRTCRGRGFVRLVGILSTCKCPKTSCKIITGR